MNADEKETLTDVLIFLAIAVAGAILTIIF